MTDGRLAMVGHTEHNYRCVICGQRPADDAGGLRAAAPRLAHGFAMKYGLIAGISHDDAMALEAALGVYLDAALAAQPAPPALDRERLARASFRRTRRAASIPRTRVRWPALPPSLTPMSETMRSAVVLCNPLSMFDIEAAMEAARRAVKWWDAGGKVSQTNEILLPLVLAVDRLTAPRAQGTEASEDQS